MDNNITNIDEVFKNAFEHAEAGHTEAEMNADWNHVASHIPQVPTHTPAVQHVANQFAGSMGKIIGFSGLGASIIVAAVILYNTYVRKPEPTTPQNKPNTETRSIQPSVSPNIDNNKSTANNTRTTDGGKTGKIVLPYSNNHVTTSQTDDNSGQTNHILPPFIPEKTLPNKRDNIFPPITPGQPIKFNLSDSILCINQWVRATLNTTGNDNIIDWGDGNFGPINGTLSHTYDKAASYAIHISGPSVEAYRLIYIIDKPKAHFIVHQPDRMVCTFNNTSQQAIKYAWNFGDGSDVEYGYYASHTYPDTGRYLVRLRAYNSNGCSDSFLQYVNVRDFSAPKVSTNVITPNNDNKNDDAYVIADGETIFTWTITDNTGQLVFQTNDKNKHWGGKNQNSGADCKPGPYYWSISYRFKQNDEPQTSNGAIQLIR